MLLKTFHFLKKFEVWKDIKTLCFPSVACVTSSNVILCQITTREHVFARKRARQNRKKKRHEFVLYKKRIPNAIPTALQPFFITFPPEVVL